MHTCDKLLGENIQYRLTEKMAAGRAVRPILKVIWCIDTCCIETTKHAQSCQKPSTGHIIRYVLNVRRVIANNFNNNNFKTKLNAHNRLTQRKWNSGMRNAVKLLDVFTIDTATNCTTLQPLKLCFRCLQYLSGICSWRLQERMTSQSDAVTIVRYLTC